MRLLGQMLLAACLTLAAPHALLAQQFLNESDAQAYREAFAAIADGRSADAMGLAARASDRTLTDVVYGLSLAAEDSTADFASYERVLGSYISWPKAERKAIARMAERNMDISVQPARVLAFFAQNDVQTANGLLRLVEAQRASGQAAKAAATLRETWRTKTMDAAEQKAALEWLGNGLSAADHAARADMLVWERKFSMTEDLFPHLAPETRKLMEARMALAKMESNAPKLMAAVPARLQNDPGLLYERMRWRRKKDDMEGAVAMMQRAARNLGHADEWWDERQMLARDLMDKGAYRNAYALVAAHGLNAKTDGNSFTDAEFMCGWLALRFLNNPQGALAHFSRLMSAAETPITMARGGYWLGRAYEALGTPDKASPWYAQAAQFGTTYYGQLAASRLYPASQVSAESAPIPDALRQAFTAQPQTTLIAQLLQTGGNKAAEDFALAWAANMSTEPEFRLLAELGMRFSDPDLAVKVSKAAAKKKIMLPSEGYPVLDVASGIENPVLAHAITRQESQFDPNVVSPSNAQGLMQLLPGTAREVAGKLGMEGYNIFDPATNMELGSYYINHMVERFDGSLPLAIAAYNAGPGRVRQWVEKMGDPRGGRMDMVDWVERIPFNETRNYVQRVMEALQLYRAKFAGGTVMLSIMQDLTGGNVSASAD